jgi:hypothetical protein
MLNRYNYWSKWLKGTPLVTDGPVDFSSRPTSSSQLGGKRAHSESEEDEIDIVGEQHGSQPMLV